MPLLASSAATGIGALLNRGAGDRSIRAEYAAVAGLRAEQGAAPAALVEEQAGVRRHRLSVVAVPHVGQVIVDCRIGVMSPTQPSDYARLGSWGEPASCPRGAATRTRISMNGPRGPSPTFGR